MRSELIQFTSDRDYSLNAIYSQMLRTEKHRSRGDLVKQHGFDWQKHEVPVTDERINELKEKAKEVFQLLNHSE